MSLSERRVMWQERIQSFKESEEKSVAAWCRTHQINVNSMYNWLKEDAEKQVKQEDTALTNWVPVHALVENFDVPSSAITVKLGQFKFEIEDNFNHDVLKILQRHVN